VRCKLKSLLGIKKCLSLRVKAYIGHKVSNVYLRQSKAARPLFAHKRDLPLESAVGCLPI